MPFLTEQTFPIPTQDLSSWTFDELSYDWDDPIYIDGNNPSNSVSARQALSLTRKLVAGFRAIGAQRGDCVCINSFNDVQYPILFHGLVAGGLVFSGVNPAYTSYELAHTLKIAKVKFLLTQSDMLDNVLKAAKEIGLPKENIIIFNPNGETAPSGFKQWNDLLQHGEEDWQHFDDLERSRTTSVARLFSSGTTGLPKATDLSHYNLIAQHTLVFEADPRDWRMSRVLNLPMFHAATLPTAFTSSLRAGAIGVVFPRFEPESWFRAHEKYGITDLTVVPPMAIMAINHPLKDVCSFKSVKVANCGAAPLDKHPQSRLQALLNEGVPFTQVWGMTETSCIATRFPYPESDTTGSVGRPLPNLDMKLVDDEGKDISAYDVQGEICIRGPTVVRGYFENPEANARDWDADNYFHTGDIGYCDGKTKNWYIVDRKKELIKVRAFQVAPPELEGVLLSHPDIVDAAVIGVPDPSNKEGSEAPRAYIVRRDMASSSPSTQEVDAWMKERLARYKQLVGGVVFVEAIPKNASGKILKRLLRDQAKKEMGSKL
ncbi:hypothetical protein LTR09_000485 [Extremus antarcticus]|uniref:Uncharacterized protein n=1 Tax=Extremus antarcticus TaxID=702011 RepID=A0AAJ0LXD8_9PEZI|nr:hypothetical protein LTR09_000485 [Extremus antarcticus]